MSVILAPVSKPVTAAVRGPLSPFGDSLPAGDYMLWGVNDYMLWAEDDYILWE